jgi:hypothetical protein
MITQAITANTYTLSLEMCSHSRRGITSKKYIDRRDITTTSVKKHKKASYKFNFKFNDLTF